MSLQSTYQSRKELLVENLETMGVTDYTADDGLTTLINAVLEIAPVPPTPTPASVTLTGTKSILSYADSEQSVLTATVLDANDDPVEGVSVDLYKDSVLWDTISTGSDGTVSKTYTSAGSGDVSITARVGSLVSETYAIEDCLVYDSQTYSNGNNVRVIEKNINLPSDNYKIEWEDYISRIDNVFLRIGADNTRNFINVGIMNNSTTYQMWTYNNGSYIEQLSSTDPAVMSTWKSHYMTVTNGAVQFKGLTATNNRTFALNQFVSIILMNCSIRNIKIKPL